MSQWIHTDNSNLKRIKIDGMSDDLWFTTEGYAETSSRVADLLTTSTEVSGISKVSEPSDPGAYYGSDVDGTTIVVKLDGPEFETLTVVDKIQSGSINTDELTNVADHVVGSTSELEAAFNNLSAGDTIWIGTPDTPYHPSQWLDIDVSNVTVVCQSSKAENGDALCKVADGANVGGIRIGANSHVENVSIARFGHDGNPTNQDSAVLRCHGIIVDDAADVTLRDCYLTRTHPYHKHDDGGSGISVRPSASNVRIENVRITDIGDRGIQLGGSDITVQNCTIDNGYDRTISLDVLPPSDEWNFAQDTRIVGNYLGGSVEGSIIGVKARYARQSETGTTVNSSSACKNISIRGNYSYGGARHGTFLAGLDPATDERISIVGNLYEDNGTTSQTGSGMGVQVASDTTTDDIGVVIANNTIRNPVDKGIEAKTPGATVSGNSITNAGGVGINAIRATTVTGNDIINTGGSGVVTSQPNSVVSANRVKGAGGHGVQLGGGTSMAANNVIQQCGDHGLFADGANFQIIIGNHTNQNGQNDNGSKEIQVSSSDSLITQNYLRGGGSPSTGGIHVSNSPSGNAYLGNFVKHGNPWNLSDPVQISANLPEPTLNSAPTSPEIGTQVIATATWDPDGDGNGERVEYDGTAWQEVVDMPNL